jgi:hypothetical protein
LGDCVEVILGAAGMWDRGAEAAGRASRQWHRINLIELAQNSMGANRVRCVPHEAGVSRAPNAGDDLSWGLRCRGEAPLQKRVVLVVVCGRWDFLSLRDPTTRWSGHPGCLMFPGESQVALHGTQNSDERLWTQPGESPFKTPGRMTGSAGSRIFWGV